MPITQDELEELVPKLQEFYFEGALAFLDNQRVQIGTCSAPSTLYRFYRRGKFVYHYFGLICNGATDEFRMHSDSKIYITLDNKPMWVANYNMVIENLRDIDVLECRKIILRNTFRLKQFFGGAGPERDDLSGDLINLVYRNKWSGDFKKFDGAEIMLDAVNFIPHLTCRYLGRLLS